jgi:hypothetical protein
MSVEVVPRSTQVLTTELAEINLAANTYDTVICPSNTANSTVNLPLLANCTLGQEFEIVTTNNSGYITFINQNDEEPVTPFTNWIINNEGSVVDHIENNPYGYAKLVVSIRVENNIAYKIWRVTMIY